MIFTIIFLFLLKILIKFLIKVKDDYEHVRFANSYVIKFFIKSYNVLVTKALDEFLKNQDIKFADLLKRGNIRDNFEYFEETMANLIMQSNLRNQKWELLQNTLRLSLQGFMEMLQHKHRFINFTRIFFPLYFKLENIFGFEFYNYLNFISYYLTITLILLFIIYVLYNLFKK